MSRIFSSSSRAIDNILSLILWIVLLKPSPGGEVNYMDQTVAVTKAAAIPRIGLKEMRTNKLWNWRLTVPKRTKMMLVRPLMTNLKMTVRADCTVSACSPLLQPIRALPHWLSVRGSWPFDRCHHPPVARIWSTANFPFHQPGLFIGFWAVSSPTLHFRNKSMVWKSYCLTFFFY